MSVPDPCHDRDLQHAGSRNAKERLRAGDERAKGDGIPRETNSLCAG